MTRIPVPYSAHLPARPIRLAEQIGAQLLSKLDRLGFVHPNRDGTCWTVGFKLLRLVGDRWLLCQVDTQRLWHTALEGLASPEVRDALAACLGREVRILFTPGLTYAIRLKAPPGGALSDNLPKMVELELSQRPPGQYVIGLGQAANGLLWRELSDLNHLIIAGSSNSGKSVFLRSLVYQLACQEQPVELYLADMEGLTFEWARHWPIVKGGIAQDVESATELTRCLLAEIERRARLYTATGRFPENLAEYHATLTRGDEGGSPLPWIVAIFDEFTALIEAAGRRSELACNVGQLAMRSRKFGVTLALAGQDFKANLLDTRITNQLKTRVQFRCARRSQSEVVLGRGGAERIQVKGRALALLDGDLIEVQTFYLDKARVVEKTRPDRSPTRSLDRATCQV